MSVCSDVYEGIPLLGVWHLYLIGSLWRKSFPHQYRKSDTDIRAFTERSFPDSTSSGQGISGKGLG